MRAIILTDEQFAALEVSAPDVMSAVETVNIPPTDISFTSDPPVGVQPVAAMSLVPAVGVAGEDKQTNLKRLMSEILNAELGEIIKNPAMMLDGKSLAAFVGDATVRRQSRVDGGAVVGLEIKVIVDSVMVRDYVDGKRSEIATVYMIEKE